MRNRVVRLLAGSSLTALLVGAAAPAFAQSSDGWSSAVQPQMELTTHLSEQLNIRFGVNRFRSDRQPLSEAGQDEVGLDDDFAASALVDWEFAPGGLRVTGGALYGDLGFGRGDLDGWTRSGTDRDGLDDLRTYVGLGWDADFGNEQRLGLQLDLGVAFEGVALDEAGGDADFLRAQEDARLGQRFESFRYVPVFSAGVEYRF